jgi:hypothetical protein
LDDGLRVGIKRFWSEEHVIRHIRATALLLARKSRPSTASSRRYRQRRMGCSLSTSSWCWRRPR